MSVTRSPALAQAQRLPLLVSHGYENIYERGFCNGLTDAGLPFVLISSDQTDYAGLRTGTRSLNLRGSQLAQRSRWRKLTNLLRYHLALMFEVARRRPVLVHVIGLIEPPIVCGVIEGIWFRLWARRYALTVHDTEPHDRANAWNRFWYRLSFRIAGLLVVHTERGRDHLVETCGVDPRRVVVMEHGIEPLARPWAPPPARADGPFRLLVFGKIMRYKGVDLLIAALRDFPHPFDLTIAGRCREPALAAELRAQIEAHPQAGSIRWDDAYVPEAEIPALFQSADALVLSYRRIDQSGVLFQALRFGLPVVASRVGSLDHYVDETVGECCAPDDAADLRRALSSLWARYDSIDRGLVRERGRRFEWQHTVRALEPLYRA